jgi:hypothetical protein
MRKGDRTAFLIVIAALSFDVPIPHQQRRYFVKKLGMLICKILILFGGKRPMRWVYWVKLYDSKFQAGCLMKRMQDDWWIYGYECPREIEVFRSRKGRYGVRYVP